MNYSIVRALKFLAFILAVFIIMYSAMLYVSDSTIPLSQFSEHLKTTRGVLLIVTIVGMAALYPLIGVTTKRVRYISDEDAVEVMGRLGFKRVSVEGSKQVFRYARFIDRIRYRFDDDITIENNGSDTTLVSGSRAVVIRIIYKLGREVL